ncbi:MAG: hypothetical protein JWO76_882, partial [Nocardioides sp.]|nr:hypothetical protein [Nocardioides sp.]
MISTTTEAGPGALKASYWPADLSQGLD